MKIDLAATTLLACFLVATTFLAAQEKKQASQPVAKPAPEAKAKPAVSPKPSIKGTFKGNGKSAKLAFVTARPGEPFAGKPTIVLVFTEKNHLREKQPQAKAALGEFGSALIVTLNEDGSMMGCVAHAAQGKNAFNLRTATVGVTDDRVEGEIHGVVKTFDKTWEVDVKFVAPLKASAGKPVAAKADSKTSADKEQGKKSAAKSDSEDEDDEVEALNVHDLAFPEDATDFEYKKPAQQMTFKSRMEVEPLAAEISKTLATQGWESEDDDLLTPKTAILKRTRGEASLMIFVKPAAKGSPGSQVTIVTDGLDWEEQEDKEKEN